MSDAATPELLHAMAQAMVRQRPPRKVVLFGSGARGDAGSDAEFDVLVVRRNPPARPVSSALREGKVVYDAG